MLLGLAFYIGFIKINWASVFYGIDSQSTTFNN